VVIVRELGSSAYFASLAPLDREDLVELRALVDEAFDLRDTPYMGDACEHIIEWRARTNLRQLERRRDRVWAALRLLRETSHLVANTHDGRRAA